MKIFFGVKAVGSQNYYSDYQYLNPPLISTLTTDNNNYIYLDQVKLELFYSRFLMTHDFYFRPSISVPLDPGKTHITILFPKEYETI
jgi:hypothetical protein